MSSEIDYSSIYNRLVTIIVPIQIVLGIVTNILNILVLTRRALLHGSPCTHYFLAVAVSSILCVIFAPIRQFIEHYAKISLFNTPVGCKLLPFLFVLMIFCIGMFFILASIDRFCQSSTLARVRSWSSVTLARRSIIITAIILPIALSPTLIVWYINYDYGGICLARTDTASTTFTIIQAILSECVPPLLMIIFGFLTIFNIRAQRNRVVAVVAGGSNRQQRTEMQLAHMLLWQVLNYLIFFLPVGITYSMSVMNSNMQTVSFGFILNVSALWNQFFYFTPFFFYILTANVYRRELIRIICCCNNRFRENQAFTNTYIRSTAGRDRTNIQ